jgi:hypothetical protein
LESRRWPWQRKISQTAEQIQYVIVGFDFEQLQCQRDHLFVQGAIHLNEVIGQEFELQLQLRQAIHQRLYGFWMQRFDAVVTFTLQVDLHAMLDAKRMLRDEVSFGQVFRMRITSAVMLSATASAAHVAH